MATGAAKNAFYNEYETFEVDPRIEYPCYKSFDAFIDVERLIGLDKFLTNRIIDDLNRTADASYFVNLHRRDEAAPYRPGVREIWLTRTDAGAADGYTDLLDRADLWKPTDAAANFAPLMSFISTLPFRETGRILIIYDDSRREVPAHRDHLNPSVCSEFIWLRTNRKKPFYMLNNETGERRYVRSYSAWFDTVNQYHGCDGVDGLTFSIRIDGVFTDEFRELIPTPGVNPASTPALWASAGEQQR